MIGAHQLVEEAAVVEAHEDVVEEEGGAEDADSEICWKRHEDYSNSNDIHSMGLQAFVWITEGIPTERLQSCGLIREDDDRILEAMATERRGRLGQPSAALRRKAP